MQPRALDHVVIPCGDLAAAAAGFTGLGFTVGRRNRHPWGTENHIVQFRGAFIELVAPSSDVRPLLSEDDAFPFAGYLAGLGASPQPSGMIVLRSADAVGDAAAFRAAGIGAGRTLHFSREGAASDGTTQTVAFTLAFAEASSMPDIGWFVCQQHYPENFWNPELQRHANGARAIAAVVIEAGRPDEPVSFLSRFANQPERASSDGRTAVALAEDCRIELVGVPGLAAPRLAALRFHGGEAFADRFELATMAAYAGR